MFDHDYEVILADTEAARAIHRKVRYQVYCMERKFETPTAFPLGEEYDPWDAHAAHFIVRQRATMTWVAAVRLVLPVAAMFPVETLQCLTPERVDCPPRRKLAEISRICIIRSSSPYKINPHMNWDYGHVGKSSESEVLLGMIRTIIIYSLRKGIEYNYILVNEAFARLLSRIGVILHSVGSTIEHRGVRMPYQVNIRETAKHLATKSATIRNLLDRKELAYKPFSLLDADRASDYGFIPPHVFSSRIPRFPEHTEMTPSPSNPGVWQIEAERSRPGPGAWRRAT